MGKVKSKSKEKKQKSSESETSQSFTDHDMSELRALLSKANTSGSDSEAASESEKENTDEVEIPTEEATMKPVTKPVVIIDDENKEHIIDLNDSTTEINSAELNLDTLPKQDMHIFKGINQLTLTFVIPPEEIADTKESFVDNEGSLVYINNPFSFFRASKANPISVVVAGVETPVPDKVSGYFMKFYSKLMGVLNAANEDVRDYRKLHNADSTPEEFKKYNELLASVFVSNLPQNPNILRTRVDSVLVKQDYISASMLNLSIIYKANASVIESVMKHAEKIKENSKGISIRVAFVLDLNRSLVSPIKEMTSLGTWCDGVGHSHDNNLAKEFISDKKTVRREILGGQTKDEIEPHVILVKTL